MTADSMRRLKLLVDRKASRAWSSFNRLEGQGVNGFHVAISGLASTWDHTFTGPFSLPHVDAETVSRSNVNGEWWVRSSSQPVRLRFGLTPTAAVLPDVLDDRGVDNVLDYLRLSSPGTDGWDNLAEAEDAFALPPRPYNIEQTFNDGSDPITTTGYSTFTLLLGLLETVGSAGGIDQRLMLVAGTRLTGITTTEQTLSDVHLFFPKMTGPYSFEADEFGGDGSLTGEIVVVQPDD